MLDICRNVFRELGQVREKRWLVVVDAKNILSGEPGQPNTCFTSQRSTKSHSAASGVQISHLTIRCREVSCNGRRLTFPTREYLVCPKTGICGTSISRVREVRGHGRCVGTSM